MQVLVQNYLSTKLGAKCAEAYMPPACIGQRSVTNVRLRTTFCAAFVDLGGK